jgi:hypothetical protein
MWRPGKLRSYWEKDIHIVVRRKSAESPGYEVKPEGTGKKRRTLHRNIILPCDFLPMDSQKTDGAPSPRPSNRRQPELVNPNTRKYMHAETLALLTKPLHFPNMKYLK